MNEFEKKSVFIYFRRSVLQFIEEKLLVFLAGIIAFADKNRNLDILINEYDWKRKIWLQIWNCPKATGLEYGDLLNQKGSKMLSEFVVEVISHDGKFFTGRMPFSWIIQRIIDKLWTHILKRPDRTEGKVLCVMFDILQCYQQMCVYSFT